MLILMQPSDELAAVHRNRSYYAIVQFIYLRRKKKQWSISVSLPLFRGSMLMIFRRFVYR